MTPQAVQTIADAIGDAANHRFAPLLVQPITGGDINQCFLLADASNRYFVKSNSAERLPMLKAEFNSLMTLHDLQAIVVPQPLTLGTVDDIAFLVLEHLQIQSNGDAKRLAHGLSKLHHHQSPSSRYGWHEDNFIGTTPQTNQWHLDWQGFWWEQRLLPQFILAYHRGYEQQLQPLAEKLQSRLPEIWGDYRPLPSLLHGDLWAGNAAYLASGEPVIYDPATYYGDREADLAMMELFGGFPPEFYREYQRLWPLAPGHEQRRPLYNLYHLLNHLNLFGRSYLAQCQRHLRQIIGCD